MEHTDEVEFDPHAADGEDARRVGMHVYVHHGEKRQHSATSPDAVDQPIPSEPLAAMVPNGKMATELGEAWR